MFHNKLRWMESSIDFETLEWITFCDIDDAANADEAKDGKARNFSF